MNLHLVRNILWNPFEKYVCHVFEKLSTCRKYLNLKFDSRVKSILLKISAARLEFETLLHSLIPLELNYC